MSKFNFVLTEKDDIMECKIEEDGVVKYQRNFDVESFHEAHYENFKSKFERDENYRKRWEL